MRKAGVRYHGRMTTPGFKSSWEVSFTQVKNVSIVNDTLPPDFSVKFLWLGWKSPYFFPGKLLQGNFVTFLVLVGLDFS